jgi:hypothetical protein
MIEHTHVEFLMFKDMFLMINSLLFETLMLFLQLHIVASTTTISAGWPPVFASSLRQPPMFFPVKTRCVWSISRIFAWLEIGENHGNSPKHGPQFSKPIHPK